MVDKARFLLISDRLNEKNVLFADYSQQSVNNFPFSSKTEEQQRKETTKENGVLIMSWSFL